MKVTLVGNVTEVVMGNGRHSGNNRSPSRTRRRSRSRSRFGW
jgi:hypothetical protein